MQPKPTNPHKRRRGRPSRPGPSKAALAAARRALDDAGISVAEWARANSFSRATVVDVLLGRRAGHHGEAHRVALALGLKEGRVADAKGFKPGSAGAAAA
jgi:gp16 family phage-associated protein